MSSHKGTLEHTPHALLILAVFLRLHCINWSRRRPPVGMAGATRVYPGVEEALRAAQSPGVLIGVEGGDGISIIGAVPTTAETGGFHAGW